jgi:hypothetical protein
VLGIPWPGFRNFPEINLRFYVRGNNRRGVMFIKELVPSSLVAWIARSTYNEPYEALSMASRVETTAEKIKVFHQVSRGDVIHTLSLECLNAPELPPESSPAHFFKEHQWGFGVSKKGKTLQYEVLHPQWNIFPVQSQSYEIDFAQLYGTDWTLLNEIEPMSCYCASGSKIEVLRPEVIS